MVRFLLGQWLIYLNNTLLKFVNDSLFFAIHGNNNKNKFMDMFLDINKEYNDYLPDYIFDENLKNEYVFEVPKVEEEKKEETDEKKEEEEEEEEKEEEKISYQENLKNYILSGNNNGQNVLDIIYGKNNNEGQEGYMSYAKRSQLRNQKFFEEYDKKQKLLGNKDEKDEKDEKEKVNNNKKRKSIYELIHGEGGIMEQLEKQPEEKKSESETSGKSSKKSDKKSKDKSKKNIDDKKDNDSQSKSQIISEIKPKRLILPYIEFNCGNFLKMDLTEASFIFCNSTCFSSELLLLISKKVNKEAQNGCIVITFTKKLPFLNNSEWEIKKGFRRLMSWGIATVFVHRRTKSINNTHSFKSSSYNETKNDSLNSSKTSRSSHSNSNSNSKDS